MKHVLITGANTGIGFETARQMAELGYYIFMGSRDKAKGIEAANKLKDAGLTNIEALEIDVSNIKSVKHAKAVLESKIEALDILINNAGISGEQPQNFSTSDIENMRRIFDTNFFGVIQTTQQFIPLLKKSNAPTIINVSSEVGSLTMNSSPLRNPNYNNYNAYGASKSALNAFTLMLSHELINTNFRVNSVTPGYTATALNNFKGARTPADGAASVVKAATNTDANATGKFFKDGNEMLW
ncbi:SDR family NAD(P)-dependent oxidoreductase [Parafilimonas sp.]|uniref:SDR family NAD(P)-dependent oxidoreductase n=1 Tax=Parafilimonas sp. TaxID=1969739 RepID=UPI0039E49237